MNNTHWPYPETDREYIAVAPPRAKGFDTSYHNHGNADNQKPIDFQAAYDSGMRFWIGRLTRGADYIDPWIVRDWRAASQTPLIKMVYHVLFPGIPVDRQISKLITGLALLPTAPAAICLDLERGWELGAKIVTECLAGHIRAIRTLWTGKLILYTNFNYLKYFITDTFGLPVWISWPAPGGAYNPDDNPPVDWVMYQRTYVQPVAGVPDLTVDQDDFNGTVEEMRSYFGEPDDPEPEPEPLPGDDDMSELDDLKAIFSDLMTVGDTLQGAQILLNDVIQRMEAVTPPPPPPVPPNTWTYQVTADKAIAYYTKQNNAAGKPLMLQIPVDERNGQPFKNMTGQTAWVHPRAVDADGPINYYEVYGVKRKGTGQALYLSAADGKIA